MAYAEEYRTIKQRLHQLVLCRPQPQQQQQETGDYPTVTGFIPQPSKLPPEVSVLPTRSLTAEWVRRTDDDDDVILENDTLPTKFDGNRDALEAWVLQLEEYFVITSVRNERQKIAFIELCLEGMRLH